MSGRITDIDAPASDVSTLYVGTAGGGVWKSTDGGVVFKPVFDDHPMSIGCVTVDPNDPETIWVGTGEINTRNSVSYGHGVYKSTNGGKTWDFMGFKDSERIGEIRVHPKDSNIVYVAALGHLWNDHEERGLYKTTDGGKNWERILYVDEKTGCIDVDLDPQEPDIVYAAMWQVRRMPDFFESGGPGSGLFKSTDGGKTFNKLTKGLPEGHLGRIDLDIAPSRPGRVYAMVESESTALYRSDDLGESWENVSSAFGIQSRPFYLSTIKVDPKDYNRVYNPSFSLFISTDGGRSWPGIMGMSFGTHPDIQTIWINPNNPKHLIIGTDGGIYVSYNHGATFRFVANLPVSMFYHVSTDNQVPYRIYGGLQDNGSWFAPSSMPDGIGNRYWVNAGGGDGFCTFGDQEDPNYVYWEMQGGDLFRLDLRTQENKGIRPYPEKGMEKNRYNWNAPFRQSLTNPKTIYFGSQYLYRSHDKGDTWERISPDLTTDDPEKQRQEQSGGLSLDVTTAENHCTIITISESPLDENIIWAGTDDGNLQVTRDGGKTWENTVANIEGLPPHTWVSFVSASHHEKGVVFATFDGHRTGDKTPYVYQSNDFGKTWKSLVTEEIQGHCHTIIQDSVNPNLLFLGTERGLFISFDQGAAWTWFRNGIPEVSIREMTIQERERDLLLATHGRGIYVLDDITPLRHLTPETLEESVAILPSRPGKAEKPRQIQDFQGAGYFAGEISPAGVQITYYLKRRHMFGDLKLEIYNDNNELIKTLPAGKRKGLNRVNWNMRRNPPRVGRASGLNMKSFFGPYVRAGNYKIRLVKGKETRDMAVALLPPPNSRFTQEERDLQQDASDKLYDMQEDVSFLADQILNLKDQCAERSKALKKGSLVKKLKEREDALGNVRQDLVAEGASIFVNLERFRDEVINLFSAITEFSGPPSPSQLDRLKVMERRMAEFHERCKPLLDLADLNQALEKKKQPPLTLLDKAIWLEKGVEEKQGVLSKNHYKLWSQYIAPLYPLYQIRY